MSAPYAVRPPVLVTWRAVAAQAYQALLGLLVLALGGWRLLRGGGPWGLLLGLGLVVMGGGLALRAGRWLLELPRRRRTLLPPQVLLDDHGVVVNLGAHAAGASARLRWDDVVAVVASPVLVQPPGERLYYVHFLPRGDDRVELAGVAGDALAPREVATGVSGPAAATAWVLAHHHLPAVPPLLAEVARRRPGLRVVDSIAGPRR